MDGGNKNPAVTRGIVLPRGFVKFPETLAWYR